MVNIKLDSVKTKIYSTAVISAIFTFVVFIPALQNDFVNWDDPLYVSDNSYIKKLDSDFFKWMFSFQDTQWIPLTRLSHALTYQIYELEPAGHHLVNVILHSLNTFLVVLILAAFLGKIHDNRQSTLQKVTSLDTTSTLIACSFAGLLFGIHPLRVESVAWISERKDVLSGFFILLSLFYYLRFTKESNRGKASRHYYYCIILYLMALLSKQIVVTFPLILIIIDVYPLKRFELPSFKPSQALKEKIPFITLSTLFIIAALVSNHLLRSDLPSGTTASLLERVLIAIRATGFYLYKFIAPLNLVPFYPQIKNVSMANTEILISTAAFASITILSLLAWKKNKVWTTVWICYLILLAPVLGIVKIGYYSAADRYTYLPGIGVMYLIGLSTAWLWQRNIASNSKILFTRTLIILFVTATVITLSSLTVKQTRIWKNSLTLWNGELSVYPNNSDALTSRGMAYYNQGKTTEALRDFNIAIEIDPANESAYYHRGLTFLMLGNFKSAIPDFNKAANLNPDNENIAYNRSLAYKLAIKTYTSSLSRSPGDLESYINRGVSYVQIGQLEPAIKDFSSALSINQLPIIYFNRGLAYEMNGQTGKSVKDFQAAARLGDKKAMARLNAAGISWQ